MGDFVRLTASDGHEFNAYRAEPEDAAKGAIVIIQEIFGVNSHIRSVVDGYAADGYLAIAPALFDRIEPGIELGYAQDDIQTGIGHMQKSPNETALDDILTSADAIADGGKVAVVGYCWGGRLTWSACCGSNRFSAGMAYYGGGVPAMADLTPNCPVILHFGEQDHAIPMDSVEAFAKAQAACPVHVYPADHGFNCDQRGSYHAESAAIAKARSLAFLDAVL